jgi:menaquinone-dependent protoporphyrinogen oxidase
MKVLMAYVTKYGSTQEVADAISEVLRERGLEVESCPAREVRSLEGYQAVVLGAPLYIGSLLKDANKFLVRYQSILEKLPVAFFALGPLNVAEEEYKGARTQLDNVLAKTPWFKPLSVELFPGKYDPSKLRFPDTLLSAVKPSPLYHRPASDLRDWDAIRAWAGQLPVALKLETLP